ncbi:AGAP009747-PA-like protein [Anopheles sinensis]|uniref:AGAP009747-PA-like protein n=1 Tax=Anopheles sinensis TaxID=74873 RepID=A0A084WU24_ANOSI|nr:AGAP009747-PA-like protein [Anopheles sinensis]
MFQKRQLRLIYLVILIIVLVLIYKSFTMPKAAEDGDLASGDTMLQPSGAPVQVFVFYETLCPDSKNFVLRQLVPAFERAQELMKIEFIPYGKATTRTKADGSLLFDCQHGPIECEGNIIHACVVEAVHDPHKQLAMVACMIRDNLIPRDAFIGCAKQHGVEIESIQKCYDSPHGEELLKIHGEATHALRPAVSFIPTVTLDGAQNDQKAILKDLFGSVCQVVAGRGPKPDVCK